MRDDRGQRRENSGISNIEQGMTNYEGKKGKWLSGEQEIRWQRRKGYYGIIRLSGKRRGPAGYRAASPLGKCNGVWLYWAFCLFIRWYYTSNMQPTQ